MKNHVLDQVGLKASLLTHKPTISLSRPIFSSFRCPPFFPASPRIPLSQFYVENTAEASVDLGGPSPTQTEYPSGYTLVEQVVRTKIYRLSGFRACSTRRGWQLGTMPPLRVALFSLFVFPFAFTATPRGPRGFWASDDDGKRWKQCASGLRVPDKIRLETTVRSVATETESHDCAVYFMGAAGNGPLLWKFDAVETANGAPPLFLWRSDLHFMGHVYLFQGLFSGDAVRSEGP